MMKAESILTLVVCVAIAGSANASRFLDDFAADTSANYVGTDTYGSGGSFVVQNDQLEVSPGAGNTHDVFHSTAQLEVGEVFSVFAPATNARDFYVTVSTITRGPNTGTEDGIRWNVLDNSFRARTYRDGQGTNTVYDSTDANLDLTLYIYRDTATMYRVGYDAGDGIVILDTIEIMETADATGLYVGVEAWTTGTRVFDNLQIQTIKAAQFGANTPYPQDGQDDVARDVVLAWNASEFAVVHDVYLGTGFSDVDDASRTHPGNALRSQAQVQTTYDPGRLELGTTYFWRIDEVNGAPDHTIHKGEVWSFELESSVVVLDKVTATASSQRDDTMGPENTVNGSGLNDQDQHSTDAKDMWLSQENDPNVWIQYEFDQVYKLHQMWVWNSNQTLEAQMGLGLKEVVIETSTDGQAWTEVDGATQFAQASGEDTYTPNTFVDFGGAPAKYVKINVKSGFGNLLQQYGISEVRFFINPTYAREPQPADGETAAVVDVVLSWRAGLEAALHEIYLGTDPCNLSLDGTSEGAAYITTDLLYDTTYYWQVVEVNDAASYPSYSGPVWSFDTPAFFVVDDFDTYDNYCDRIFFRWQDGIGHPGGADIPDCDEASYAGNGSGAIVGYDNPPFAEQVVVLAGKQSMPLEYNNAGASGMSEATRELGSQNWQANGIQILSLSFYGDAANTGQLYLKINNTKIPYNGDPAEITSSQWQLWSVDLSTVNANLESVNALTIGIEGANAKGKLYIDEIRLYPTAVEEPNVPAPEVKFIDDFDADTSSDYTYSDSYGFGGSFDVSGGTLNVTAASGNTATVMTTNAVSFEVGQSVSVDMPVKLGDMFLCISTVAAQPDGSNSFGVRYRRDTSHRMHLYPGGRLTGVDEPAGGPALTAIIKRMADTEFEAYYQLPGLTPTLVNAFTLPELAGITQLHIGVQAWDATVSFDNLKITE